MSGQVFFVPEGHLDGGSPYAVYRTVSGSEFLGLNDNAPQSPATFEGVVSGADAPIPDVLGRQRVQVRMQWANPTGDVWCGIGWVCQGRIEGFDEVNIDGRVLDTTGLSHAVVYTGDADGTTQERNIAAVVGHGGQIAVFDGRSSQNVGASSIGSGVPNYPDGTGGDPLMTLGGGGDFVPVAAVVVRLAIKPQLELLASSLPSFPLNGFPTITAVVRGQSGMAGGYTANPAAGAAWWLTERYKPGTTSDAASLAAAIAYHNETTPGEVRREWGLEVGQRWLSDSAAFDLVIRAAGIYPWEEDGVWYYNVEGPTASTHTFNSKLQNVSLSISSADEWPDNVAVRWYDVDEDREKIAYALDSGGRATPVDAVWIGRYSEAKRYAIEMYESLRLYPEFVAFDVHGAGLFLRCGEVFTLTEPEIGVTALDYRCLNLTLAERAGWVRVFGKLHSDTIYDDTLQTDPVTSAPTLSSDASNPPTLAGLSVAATVTGRVANLSISWTDPDYAWLQSYEVRVFNNDDTGNPVEIGSANPVRAAAEVQALPFHDYLVRVRALSRAGRAGPWTEGALAEPSLPTPPDVTNLRAHNRRPVINSDNDSVLMMLLWDDPDYTAWLAYRAKLYVIELGEYTSLRAADGLSSGDFDPDWWEEPSEVFDLPQGGSGRIEVPAGAIASWPSTVTVGFITFHSINAEGVESAGVKLVQGEYFGGAFGGSFIELTQTDGMPSFDTRNADLVNTTSRGGLMDFAISNAQTFPTGVWLYEYDSNSSGTSRTLVNTYFVSASELFFQFHDQGPNGTAEFTNWRDAPGIPGVIDLAPASSLAFQRRIPTAVGTVYKQFDYAWAGWGGQVGEQSRFKRTGTSGASDSHYVFTITR